LTTSGGVFILGVHVFISDNKEIEMRRMVLAAVLGMLITASAAQAWTWPVVGEVVKGFAFDHSHPYAGGQHRGIDVGASTGTAVSAPAAGTVTSPERSRPAERR